MPDLDLLNMIARMMTAMPETASPFSIEFFFMSIKPNPREKAASK